MFQKIDFLIRERRNASNLICYPPGRDWKRDPIFLVRE